MFIQVTQLNKNGWVHNKILLNTELVAYFSTVNLIQNGEKIKSNMVHFSDSDMASIYIKESANEIEMLINKAYANLRGRLF